MYIYKHIEYIYFHAARYTEEKAHMSGQVKVTMIARTTSACKSCVIYSRIDNVKYNSKIRGAMETGFFVQKSNSNIFSVYQSEILVVFNSIFLFFFDLTIFTYTFVRDKIYLQWIAVILKIRSYIKLSLLNQKELSKTVEHKNSNKNHNQMNNADCSNFIKYLFRCNIY